MIQQIDTDDIEGFLHVPDSPNAGGVVLTHGAGADCRTQLLLSVAEQLTSRGYHVLRVNLAFRRGRRVGPPHPSLAAKDRQSLEAASVFLRTHIRGPLILSGHSYGGRQASILISEKLDLADGLLLFSYPLHPPDKPHQLRTGHFPSIRRPAIFVQGEADPFGTPDELRAAISLIPSEARLVLVPKAGHDLKKGKFELFSLVETLH